MSKSPYLMGDSIKYSYKPKDYHHHTHKAKGITFLASIFSFFICMISILYVLNHSPSNTYTTLFNNNIFWFFMSNTLILFIAADYEAFSSSKNKQDQLYQEYYVKHSHARNYNHIHNYVSAYPKYEDQVLHEKSVIPTPNPPPKKQAISDHKSEIIESTPPERVLEIVVQNNKEDPARKSSSEKKAEQDDDDTSKGCEEKTVFPAGRAVGRSKSDRHGHVVKRVVIDESKNRVMMRRSETMKKKEEEAIREKEENNEFSNMTNEELNRRVEEFIQRFNRQMRLQAARNNVVNVY